MPIRLVKFFDSPYSDGEKMVFQIGGWHGASGYNISQGLYKTHGDDYLSKSPLWRGRRTNEQWRQYLWQIIKLNLPKYNQGKIDLMRTSQWDFRDLMFIAIKVSNGENVDLVYLDDLEHAELTKRCLEWLAKQIF